MQSLQNQLLFYLVLKLYKCLKSVKLLNLAFVLNVHCILYSTHSTHEYFSKVLSTYLSTFTKCVLSTYSSTFKTVSTQYLLKYFFLVLASSLNDSFQGKSGSYQLWKNPKKFLIQEFDFGLQCSLIVVCTYFQCLL